MAEESFVDLYLQQKLTSNEFKQRGISYKILSNSVRFYKSKYPDEIKERKHFHYSHALKGNLHGKKDSPGVLIPLETLIPYLEQGYSWKMIGKELGVSAWFVRQSMRHYKVSRTGKLPYRLMNSDMDILLTLDQYAPGIAKAAIHYYEDPQRYFQLLYEAHLQVIELTWFIKEQSRAYAGFLARKKLQKSHICWSSNRSEMLLSKALLDNNIPHVRQVLLFQNYLADFGFPGKKLLVEIDGDFHKQMETQKRDVLKKQYTEGHGYTTLNFSTREIEKNLLNVVEAIRSALDTSPTLNPSE